MSADPKVNYCCYRAVPVLSLPGHCVVAAWFRTVLGWDFQFYHAVTESHQSCRGWRSDGECVDWGLGSVTKWLPTPLIELGTDRGQVSAWTNTVKGFELISLKSSLLTLYTSQSSAASWVKNIYICNIKAAPGSVVGHSHWCQLGLKYYSYWSKYKRFPYYCTTSILMQFMTLQTTLRAAQMFLAATL